MALILDDTLSVGTAILLFPEQVEFTLPSIIARRRWPYM